MTQELASDPTARRANGNAPSSETADKPAPNGPARSVARPLSGVRVIFVNRFFYPDHSATSQMLSDLAFELADRGADVAVITSRLRYDAPDQALPKAETVAGVKIIRVQTTRFGRGSLFGRAFDYLTFYVSAACAVLWTARKRDIVVAMTDPPMVSAVLLPVTKMCGARLVNWLQDVFPEVAINLGFGGRLRTPLLRWAQALRDVSLRRADLNVAIGSRMAERISAYGVEGDKIRIIPNWADCSQITPIDRAQNGLRREWGLGESFVVGYSGNLGRAHDIQTLLEAIAATDRGEREHGGRPVRWLFIGGGAGLEALRLRLDTKRVQNAVFRPYQPRKRLSESLSAADVHIVSLMPNLEGLVVPSKFYGAAAAGRALIFIGAPDGEIALIINKYGCGRTVQVGDSAGLLAQIEELERSPAVREELGRSARMMCEELFDKRAGAMTWSTEIAKIP